MTRGKIRDRLALGVSAAALVWMGGLVSAAPARAFDDKPSTFEPLLNVVGLGKDDESKPDIDFRERPKLVVPKSVDLPPPQQREGSRAANWPQDPEVQRRRAAATAARAPQQININANPALSPRELQQGRAAESANAQEVCDTRISGGPDCSALTPAEKLKRVFSLGSSDNKDVLTPGVEPTRDYLTEPPPGYRKAVTVQRATTDGPLRKYESPSSGEYARGVDPNKKNDD